MNRLIFPALALAMAISGPAVAASHEHSVHQETAEAASASTDAYRASAARMHEDMAIPYTGDADRDFAAAMIGHHEGAIAMARIVLEHGKDPEIRKLAEEVIAAQEKEVAVLKDWLSRQTDR
jgi:uncharacterized protein (DUF305 family)